VVRIPETTFVMGTDAARVDTLMARFGVKRRELFSAEVPARTVTVRAFFIDATEVTNAAFKGFLDRHPEWSRDRLAKERHNGEYLKTWNTGTYPEHEGELPVTFVTWHAASAYCGSTGKRLPTEAEWELAAGGGQAMEFPWGDDDPDPTRANFSATGLGKPVRVRSFPPVRGLYDMAGNVWEFVADRWDEQRYVIRGGSFGGSPVNLRVRYRDSHPALGAGPHVGFRCARSVEVDKR
jgi:iron(II)-dependent oxidoreductase